jgi:hypothetical protein
MSIRQTSDGGYIVSGNTYSNDGDVSGNHGNSDYWVVKLDSTGNIQWQKCLGGSLNDNGTSIEQTADGGYIVAGITSSNDGDITGFHGIQDYWVVKLDVTGIIQWQKCLGGTNQDQATSIWQTSDGGFTVAGVVGSNDGDVTGNHGAEDYWVVKLDGSGTLVWQQCLGGTDGEVAISIQQTADSSYIVAGYTWSNDGNVTGNHGLDDYWVVKLDISGNLLWQKCLGGTIQDYGGFIQQTVDGGYIIAGSTLSNDGDVTGNHGNHDYWVVKLSALTSIEEYKTPELRVFPNPVRSILTILLPGKEEFIIQIIDLFGKLIYSEKTNSTQINLDMTNFPEGDYFLKMQTENTSVTNIISVIK